MNLTARLSFTRPDFVSLMIRFLVALVVIFGFVRLAPATTVDIHAIQVFSASTSGGFTTPYSGQTVTTTGIVIGVLSDGFYIENPSSDFDSNTCTSEGIYVYTPTGVPSNAVLGNSLTVTGVVQSSNSSAWAGTEIYIASPVVGTTVVTASTGNSLPSAISSSVITAAITDGGCSQFSADSFGQWLPFEGMRVTVPSSSSMLVTAGTGGTVLAASASATTNGNFWATITDSSRLFRATGIDELDPAYTSLSADLPSGEVLWDGNPSLLLVNSTALLTSSSTVTSLEASAGMTYTSSSSSDLIGIVDYHLSNSGYTGLILTEATVEALSGTTGKTPVAATAPSSGVITIAQQNLEQDASDSDGTNGLVAAETNRITKLANAIVNYENSPDVVAVQAATPAALSALVTAISSASGPTYTVYEDTSATNSADSNGLVNAFLVNDTKFVSGKTTVAAELGAATWTNYSGTTGQTSFPRVPQLLKVEIARTGISNYVLYILNANLLARTNLSGSTLATTMNAQLQREAQADQLASLVATLEASGDHVMVVGGLNSFEYSDGYVDTLGILTNSQVGSSYVWTHDSNSYTTGLVNTTTTAKNLTDTVYEDTSATNPAASRYTYTENGSAEQPDHILLTSEMSSLVAIDYARIAADFPVSDTYTTSTVARASAHDAVIAYLTIPYPTETTVSGTPNPTDYDDPVTFTATVQVYDDATNTVDTSLTVTGGTVTFTDTTTGTVLCSAVDVDTTTGTAACTTSVLTVAASHTITAAYSGYDVGLGFQASSGTTTQEVDKDTTTLTLALASTSENPSYYTEPVSFTITATGAGLYGGTNTPTGTVYLCDVTSSSTCTATSSNVVGSVALSSGTATVTLSKLAIGTYTLEAFYPGDTDDSSAISSTLSHEVDANTATVVVTSSENPSYYGDSVTFTATVSGTYGTPGGTVLFYDKTNAVYLTPGTLATASGTYTATATTTTSSLAVGSHVIQALYQGDTTTGYSAANNSVTQVVQKNHSYLMLTATPNPAYYGKTVTLTATASADSGTPTGTVSFYYYTASATTPVAFGSASLSSGVATLAATNLPVGTDVVYAYYGGTTSGVWETSTSNTISEIILPTYSTVSTLTCSPNPQQYGVDVTCTDVVAVGSGGTGTPTGTVTFYDASTLATLGTITSSTGTFSYTTSALTVGTHNITATYAENDPYLSSAASYTEVIDSTFTITASPTSTSVYTGESATYGLTIAPGAGFSLDVALTCNLSTTDPTMGCTVSPSTISGGSGTAKLVITTTAPKAVSANHTPTWRGAERGAPLLAGLLLLFVPKRLRKRGLWMLGMLLLAILATGGVTGCGGSGTLSGGTAAGAYTATVTGMAVDGTLTITESTTVTLNVKSMF